MLLGYERIAVKELGKSRSGQGTNFVLFFTAVFFFIPFLFHVEWPQDLWVYAKIFVCAIIYSITFTLYVKSLTDGEVSLVGPLYNFNVFFLLGISVIFLGESFTFNKVFGLILMIYGSSWLNRQGNFFLSIKAIFNNRPCQLMILFSLLLSVGRVADKILIKEINPVVYGFVLYSQISIILYFYNFFTGRKKLQFALLIEKPFISLIAGAINTYSYIFLLYAIKTIEISVAEPANMLSMVISVILARVLYKEKIKERAVGILIMIIGAFFLL
ncbi:MAG: DMT family transporter [Candidatus Muirbacterium halophilum]|nr:DMT family transporter [Candidatus Muirbacterium halophilum]